MQFHFHANQTHFHKNGFALRHTLKQRHKGTRKWPINFCQSEMNTNLFWSAVRVLEGAPGRTREGLVDVFLRLRWWGGAKEGKKWFLYPFQNVQYKLLERVGGGVIIVFE